MGQITRTNFGLTSTRILDNDEIINLPQTQIQIVPARANAIIWPVLTLCVFDWAVDYGAIDATARLLLGRAGIGNTGGITEQDSDVSGLLAAGHDTFCWFQPACFPVDLSNSFGYSAAVSDFKGQALSLSIDNGGGAVQLTGGDPANSLTVTVFYVEVPVP